MPADFAALVDPILKGLEIVTVGAGAAAVFYKLGQTTQKFELIGEQQSKEISQLKVNAEKVAAGQGRIEELMMKVALQGQRLDNQAERQLAYEKRADDRFNRVEMQYDELRRGEGLITGR